MSEEQDEADFGAQIRVFFAGAEGAPLSNAVLETLKASQHVDLVGVAYARVRSVPECDLLLTSAHRFLIPSRLLMSAKLGAVGLHPSLLPKYRGTYPLWWALHNEERVVGITLFHLVDKVDAGPIIDQTTIDVMPLDSFGSLYQRVVEHVPAMLNDFLARVATSGRVPAGVPQDASAATVYAAPGQFQLHLWRARRKIARLVLRRSR